MGAWRNTLGRQLIAEGGNTFGKCKRDAPLNVCTNGIAPTNYGNRVHLKADVWTNCCGELAWTTDRGREVPGLSQGSVTLVQLF